MARWMRSLRPAAVVLCAAVLALLVLPASALALVSTGDGGWQWLDPQPQGNNLEAVVALDAQDVVIGGDNGTLLTTSDGGAGWSSHDLGIASSHVAALSFVGAQDGWAAIWQQDRNGGSNRAYLAHTSDGGATWTVQRFAWFPTALDFVDVSHGWVCTGSGVWSTSDGGRVWKFHAVPANWGFSSIDFIDVQPRLGGRFDHGPRRPQCRFYCRHLRDQ